MGDRSGIEWTEATWNPTTGCDRTSPGCDRCYALAQAARLKAAGVAEYQHDGDERTSGPGFGYAEHPGRLDQPLRWQRPRRIFVNSMSDLFHKDATEAFIGEVFAVMAQARQHTFQLLTKRSQRMATSVASWYGSATAHQLLGGSGPIPNLWVGTSIESDRYCYRADHLRSTPAAVRFLSLEPLIGPLPSLDLTGIDWVIVGGESGPGARPMNPHWVLDLRDRCAVAGVAFMLKQWGEWRPCEDDEEDVPDAFVDATGRIVDPQSSSVSAGWPMRRVGKHRAGRLLSGVLHDEYPTL